MPQSSARLSRNTFPPLLKPTEHTTPVPGSGYPASESYVIGECLGTILSEEFEHRRYAERDLATLQAGTVGAGT